MASRDQELRFNVHEAPDYYQLKVSVFNDDKKTELIGDGWIDLKTVIVPGGGQSDVWHPLQFRGKYAGEIRIELTYYDIRPRDESVIEKRRESERNALGSRNHTPDKSGSIGGPRQLGPREIKRRPLPADPTGSSPLPPRPSLPEHPHSSPGPYTTQIHDYQAPVQDTWHPPYQQSMANPSTPNNDHNSSGPYDFTLPPRGQDPEPQDYRYHDDAYNPSNYDETEQSAPLPEPNDSSYMSSRQSYQPQQLPHTSFADRFDDRRHSAQPTFPSHDHDYQTSSQYGSSPPGPPQIQGSAEGRQQGRVNRYSTSPIKNDNYRDSPLRQSVSHSQIGYNQHIPESHTYDDEDDVAPPPPPAHRTSNSRPMTQSLVLSDPNAVQVPEPLQIGPSSRKMSVDDRSPLQNLERQYNTRIQPDPIPTAPANRAGSYTAYNPTQSYNSYQPRPRANSRDPSEPDDIYDRNPYSGRLRESNSRPLMTTSPTPVDREREIYGPTGRSSQLDYGGSSPLESRSGMRTSTAGVPVVRPRAISPDARSTTRKSVSPQVSVKSQEHGLNGIPFSPDSYDVFNPTSTTASVVSGPEERYETPEQAMEVARQREVQKLREQGPIIGNDGRVIDPSDHLPTDTWAPEAERKKKPEDVIRFNAGGPPRTPNSLGSSPAPARPSSMSTPTYGSSPAPTPIHSSPASVSPPKFGRNRLQKSQPPRPFTQSSYQQHASSSPSVPQASQHNSSPSFEPLHRNSVSEYPLREHQNYGNGYNSSPRSPAYPRGAPPIPAKIPIQKGFSDSGNDRYGGFGHVDALTAEMNSIDIGVGNGGREPKIYPRPNPIPFRR